MKEIEPISLDGVKSYPLSERKSLVNSESFALPFKKGGALSVWLERLPRILAAKDFMEVSDLIAQAACERKTVILAMGAHPIKVGLSPIIIDLMGKGIISALAMNGAGIIHDSEVAMVGRTSEDVADGLGCGSFGMAEETGRILNQAITRGAEKGWGLGKSVGAALIEGAFPFNRLSILASAFEMKIPVTVHVAIGTDIIHVHPTADGAATGKASHTDFRIFARMISTLNKGVFINLGSAVVLPEVFLKALTLVRNLGYEVDDFTTVNMDFIRQYRPMTNVVNRPTRKGGRGFNLTGHHELMFPLLAAAVMERLGPDYFEKKELQNAHI
ncbi:MAG: hypothetical protein COZ70_08005 [Deltaproteobacteria bacterium CG_4_8_14_3_um_filter_51_11]|nr:hypothetical protein [bacterium]OIP37180.1 MAG: hypothetical protein AUK25_15535 [Desulfobacteraceae bacterium CG2_30_51_40]PIP47649.1 MAG: hypothetical protein COX16_03490 [Deltaproteobacteria bacterium CG23_combo_of_CG06-09_8_20_14_all_51_20]PIX19618.1 MAG: hypothetical protein COZ70_08005 [Deltaproteobacteria bacterium CG_4_8_14_3_um_filter_51_11]PJB37578.1 MAG: hypothetical protein CO107_04340 [Deltaproteobacteria bacterium CG_4_9_14_3_um_filter_51_14]